MSDMPVVRRAVSAISVTGGGDRGAAIGDAAWFFARIVLVQNWRSLAGTVVACGIAGVIATFQWAVFVSFFNAGSAAARAIGGDYWVSAAGVECFDFPDAIDEDYAGIVAREMPGARVRRVIFGFAPWRSPLGRRGNVALVGVDDLDVPPTGFVADRSDLARLDLADAPADRSAQASIGDVTLDFAATRDDVATFLGVPYMFVRLETARQVLRADPSAVSYLAITVPPGSAVPDLDALARHFPEIAIRPATAFQFSSAYYWEAKTGAGLAILLASALAGVLMVLLLVNGIMRFVQQHHGDLISVVGHGAGLREIVAVIAIVTAAIILVYLAVSAIATPLMIAALRGLLPWARFHVADLAVPLAGGIAAFAAAMLWVRRNIAQYSPDAIFRS